MKKKIINKDEKEIEQFFKNVDPRLKPIGYLSGKKLILVTPNKLNPVIDTFTGSSVKCFYTGII